MLFKTRKEGEMGRKKKIIRARELLVLLGEVPRNHAVLKKMAQAEYDRLNEYGENVLEDFDDFYQRFATIVTEASEEKCTCIAVTFSHKQLDILNDLFRYVMPACWNTVMKEIENINSDARREISKPYQVPELKRSGAT